MIVSELREQSSEYRLAMFITCVGQVALELYITLRFESEEAKKDMRAVLQVLKDYFLGMVNTTYELAFYVQSA